MLSCIGKTFFCFPYQKIHVFLESQDYNTILYILILSINVKLHSINPSPELFGCFHHCPSHCPCPPLKVPRFHPCSGHYYSTHPLHPPPHRPHHHQCRRRHHPLSRSRPHLRHHHCNNDLFFLHPFNFRCRPPSPCWLPSNGCKFTIPFRILTLFAHFPAFLILVLPLWAFGITTKEVSPPSSPPYKSIETHECARSLFLESYRPTHLFE